MSLEHNLLKTLTGNLNLIDEFRITSNIFYSEFVKSVFEKMVDSKNKGYKLYQPNDFEINKLSDAKFIPKENVGGVKNDIFIETQKKLVKESIKNIDNYLDRKDLDFNLNEVIIKTNKQLSKHNSMGEDVKDVFSSKDEEFDLFNDKILNGDFTFVSDIKTKDWKCFDNGMRGLRPNKTTILLASTGIGKTSFSVNLARLIAKCEDAKKNDKWVLYLNLEMEAEELYHRIICALGDLTLEDFEKAKDDKDIRYKIKKAHLEFKELNLYLTSDKPKTVEELQYLIDQKNVNNKLCLVVIDYLGKIKDREVENDKEYKKLFEWMSFLNEKRSEYTNYHLWILSQLNREAEKSENASARESTQGSYAILQDVDTVLSLIPSSDGFIIKNEKNRGARDQWLVLFDFIKNTQTFNEIGWTTLKEIKKKKSVDIDF